MFWKRKFHLQQHVVSGVCGVGLTLDVKCFFSLLGSFSGDVGMTSCSKLDFGRPAVPEATLCTRFVGIIYVAKGLWGHSCRGCIVISVHSSITPSWRLQFSSFVPQKSRNPPSSWLATKWPTGTLLRCPTSGGNVPS